MKEVALQYILDGAYLPVGEKSGHEECPFCHGGSSGERTFVIKRVAHDLLTFRCYRDSCGASGCVSVSGGQLVQRESKSQKAVVSYEAVGLTTLSDEQLSIINRKCNTNSVQLVSVGVKIDATTNRVMFPLYDTEGEHVGYILRYYQGLSTGKETPKALTHWFDDKARIAFTTRRRIQNSNKNKVILVEDWPSANRITAAGVPAATILGTGLTFETLKDLLIAGYNDVVLCLDADAKATAIRHKLKFGAMFGNFSLKLLSNKDVKDMDDTEFKEFMSSI